MGSSCSKKHCKPKDLTAYELFKQLNADFHQREDHLYNLIQGRLQKKVRWGLRPEVTFHIGQRYAEDCVDKVVSRFNRNGIRAEIFYQDSPEKPHEDDDTFFEPDQADTTWVRVYLDILG